MNGKSACGVRWEVAAKSAMKWSGLRTLCGEPPASGARVDSPGALLFQQGGGNLCCQRGKLNKDPAGALIYATRQTTQGQCRCKPSEGFVRRVCSALAAARATRWRAKLWAAGGLAATGMKEPK